MFKRRPKIVQIYTTTVGDFIFLYGLGRDSRIYVWLPAEARWQLHKVDKAQTDAAQ